MNIRRVFAMGALLLLLMATALSVADAKQACSVTLNTCMDWCNEKFTGSTDFDGFQRQGCRVGCTMGYGWCLINS